MFSIPVTLSDFKVYVCTRFLKRVNSEGLSTFASSKFRLFVIAAEENVEAMTDSLP
jgi:hypothetical protein